VGNLQRLNDKMYLIVSAATKGSRYEALLEKQSKLYKEFNYLGMVMQDRGSWAENTKIKIDAILAAFEYCPNVLWIDADCELEPPNNLPDGEFDVGWIKNKHPHHKCKISAGYIYFRDTERTREFLALWSHFNCLHKKDHPALMDTFKMSDGWLVKKDLTDWLGVQKINTLLPRRGAHIL